VPVTGFFLTNYLAIGQLKPAYGEFGGPWYEYEGSYWRQDSTAVKRGIDWAGTMVDFGCRAPVNALIEAFGRHGVTLTEEEVRRDMGKAKADHVHALLNYARVVDAWRAVNERSPTAQDRDALIAELGPLMRAQAAQAAFEKVTEVDPQNPDGWLNIGRAALQEGDLPRARSVLDKALALNPKLARTNFFYGSLMKSTGDYDQAATHFQIVIAQYPHVRVALNNLGRILFSPGPL